MAKTGRPTKFNESLALRILELAKKGATDEEIAAGIGIGVRTLQTWKAGREDFRQALKTAKDVADQLVVASLFRRATGYRHKAVKFFNNDGVIISQEYEEVYAPDTTACIFWLKNRKPEEWRDRQEIAHTLEPFVVDLGGGREIVAGVKETDDSVI